MTIEIKSYKAFSMDRKLKIYKYTVWIYQDGDVTFKSFSIAGFWYKGASAEDNLWYKSPTDLDSYTTATQARAEAKAYKRQMAKAK